MEIRIINDSALLRQKYTERFLLSRDDFKTAHKDFVSQLEEQENGYEKWYDEAYMWDKLPAEYPEVSFAKALELLRAIKGNVLFMSEKKGFGGACHIKLNDAKIEGFVASADSYELSQLIESEWYDSCKCFREERYYEGSLPEDLYVFDQTFTFTIVFTHETDWEAEPSLAQDTRFCIAYGIENK